MPLKVLIVDDEPFAREDLRYMLGKHSDIEVIWEAEKIDEARKILARNTPDVVFIEYGDRQIIVDTSTSLWYWQGVRF